MCCKCTWRCQICWVSSSGWSREIQSTYRSGPESHPGSEPWKVLWTNNQDNQQHSMMLGTLKCLHSPETTAPLITDSWHFNIEVDLLSQSFDHCLGGEGDSLQWNHKHLSRNEELESTRTEWENGSSISSSPSHCSSSGLSVSFFFFTIK